MSTQASTSPQLDFESQRITTVYRKTPAGHHVKLDVQLPSVIAQDASLPVLISWHGGALFVGSRRDPMPPIMTQAILSSGCIIIYPDYHLLDPSSCWDLLDDIAALHAWLESDAILDMLPNNANIDRSRIGILGFSAGGWLARMSTVYFLKQIDAQRSILIPRACCLFYGMAGDLTLDYWVKPRPLRAQRPDHLAKGIEQGICSDSSYTEAIFGENTAERAAWCDYWWDSGTYMDLCLKQTGFSQKLLQTAAELRESTLDSSLEDILPQIFLARNPLAKSWPITLLVHGTSDNIVPVEESRYSYRQMQRLGLPASLRTVQNGNHDLVDATTGEYLPDKGEALLESALFIICHLRQ